MSILFSPTEYRMVWGTGCSWRAPSRRQAIRWSKAVAFQANRPAGLQRGGDPLERAAQVSPGRQVQQGSERAVNEPGRLLEGQIADVTLAQVEVHAGLGGAGKRLGEHRR
jgi:hypothetical protein